MDPIISAITKGPEFRIDGLGAATAPTTGGAGGGFGSALSDMLEKLDSTHAAADEQARALATGETDDIATVVSEIERASLALQLAVQVRNKTVDAYHELFRMPV
jgi:flagellar hook-basal body complex protein FliE